MDIKNVNPVLYKALLDEDAELDTQLKSIIARKELIKSLLKSYGVNSVLFKEKTFGFVPSIKQEVTDYILRISFPTTNNKLYKQFNIPEDQKGNFGSMLKTLRKNGIIAAIKYESNNVLTFYGNPKRIITNDFDDNYKTEEMKKLKDPKRV